MKQRLREEQERAGRAEAELLRIHSQQAGGYEASAVQQVGARGRLVLVGLVIVGLVRALLQRPGLHAPLSLPQLLLLQPLSLRV